jgi:hypothetical protein
MAGLISEIKQNFEHAENTGDVAVYSVNRNGAIGVLEVERSIQSIHKVI